MKVLILLLVAIIIVILGKTFITSTNQSPEELNKTISLQRKQILKDQNYIFDLTQKIDALNDTILSNDVNCNENAISQERVYAKKLMEQQLYVTKTIEEVEKLLTSGNPKQEKMLMAIKSDTIKIKEIPTTSTKILEKLEKIKKNVKNAHDYFRQN